MSRFLQHLQAVIGGKKRRAKKCTIRRGEALCKNVRSSSSASPALEQTSSSSFRETQSLRTSAEIVRQVNVKYRCQWFIYLIMPACCFSAVTYLIFTASPEILRIKYRKDFASAINVSLRAMLACDRPATPS